MVAQQQQARVTAAAAQAVALDEDEDEDDEQEVYSQSDVDGRGLGDRAPQRDRDVWGGFKTVFQQARLDATDFPCCCRGFTVPQFDALATELAPAIAAPRNVRGVFTPEENADRRPRPAKLTIPERLFVWFLQVGNHVKLKLLQDRWGWSITSLSDDFRHITEAILSTLGYEVPLFFLFSTIVFY
jgi:hypothetical protein